MWPGSTRRRRSCRRSSTSCATRSSFESLGARVPKGILFHGPPGTGKTLAAKAVANESGARFYAQSASAFVEMFAGLGAARIRKLFEEARKNAPSIVFIDELDAVGQARSGHSFNREQDQTLNQLLVELDGFGPRDQVVVMAASNRLQDLDQALLRPGRFDRQILIQPPDLKGRIEILDVHTRGKPLAEDVDLDGVARQTAGPDRRRPGEHLQRGCDRRRPRTAVTSSRWRTSTTRSSASSPACSSGASSPTRRSASSPTTRAATRSSRTSSATSREKATIIARGTALGYVLHLPEEERYLETKEELLDWMVMALAGRAAEELVFGRVTNGAANDLEKVTQIARAMVFEWGMGESVTSRTMRADNYALSEETKRLRDTEQARLTDHAYSEARAAALASTALRSTGSRPRCSSTRRSSREELVELFVGVEPDSQLLRLRRRRPRARRRPHRVAFAACQPRPTGRSRRSASLLRPYGERRLRRPLRDPVERRGRAVALQRRAQRGRDARPARRARSRRGARATKATG